MILVLYNVALIAVLVIGAPWWLWRLATTEKYREGLRERLGAVPERLTRILTAHKDLDEERALAVNSQAVIWLHAVSVGEVLAVSRLVSELDLQLPKYRVMISTTTRTGQALAWERFGKERVFYCPLDLPWAVRAYIKALDPVMLILAETEFWPNLLSECFRRNTPVVVVNARISDRSWPRYLRVRRLWSPFLRQLTAVLAQSAKDRDRLLALGCEPERVTASGNLKFDVRAAQEAEATRLLRSLTSSLRLIVAGSTVDGEEKLLLRAWPGLLELHPQLAMVIAPRHPERFAAVRDLLAQSGFAWRSRSSLAQSSLAIPQGDFAGLEAGEIVLLDSIGELASVYSLASVAFVGGSLVPSGGHNPLEPAQFGVPVVMGEHYENFQAIVDDLLEKQAIVIVSPSESNGSTGSTALAREVAELLGDSNAATAMGERGKAAFERRGGVTARTAVAIAEILKQRQQRGAA